MMAGIREGLPENKTSSQAGVHIENERRQPKRLLGRRGSVHVKRRKLGRQSQSFLKKKKKLYSFILN